MPLIDLIPGKVRHLPRALLPAKTADVLREEVVQRFYVPSNVTRESGGKAFVRRWVSHGRPTLYHLDMHVTDHCNLKCKGCETYSPICPPRFTDLAVFDRDMARLAELFENIEHIYLVGGEPLLHPQIAEFVRVGCRHFPRSRLRVLTNTTLVPRMGDEFFSAMRETDCVLNCDLYPVGIDVDAITKLARDEGIRLEWTEPVAEFHKVPIDPAGSCNARMSHLRCKQVANCPIVRGGRLFPCQRAAYGDIIAERFDLPELNATGEDSIDLADVRSGDAAIDFLMKPVPWCAKCDFDAKETFAWARSTGDASEWLACEAPAAGNSPVDPVKDGVA